MRQFLRRHGAQLWKLLREGDVPRFPALSLGGLAADCARHPWRTVAIWAVTLAAASTLVATQLGGALTTVQRASNNPEYAIAEQIIDERFDHPHGSTELVIVQAEASTVDEPSYRALVEQLHADVTAPRPGNSPGRGQLLPNRRSLAGIAGPARRCCCPCS